MIPADFEQWRAREVARLLALVEGERRYYQDILASVPAGLAVVGADLSLVSANRTFRALFELRDTPLSVIRLRDLFASDEVGQAIAAALGQWAPATSLSAMSTSGKRLDLRIQPLHGWSDETEVLVLVQEAAEPEGGLRVAESTSPVFQWLEDLGAIVWERDAASMQFAAVHGAAEAVLGYEASHWLSTPDFQLRRAHPEDRPWVEEFYRRVAAGESLRACEYRALAADGRTVWLRDVVSAVRGEADARAKLRGITVDITEPKLRGEQRLRSEKMAALGRLAARVSQDSNNLLLVIAGYAEELRNALPPDHPARHDAGEIVAATQRLSRIQRELHTSGRPPVLRPKVFEVNALMQSLAQEWRRQMGETTQLVLSLDPQAGSVKGDAEALAGVLKTLVEAARAAMPGGGQIEVATSRVQVRPVSPRDASGAFATVTIRDSGPDLDEEARSRLFEPFYSCGRFPQGLAGVYSAVRGSGGDISVSAAPRGGVCFTLSLPQVDVAEVVSAGPPEPRETWRKGGETVLVVEDEGGIRALMRKILQKQGYEVLEARNGEEALGLAEEHAAPIHLLLTDIEMPEMSGYELANRLKALRPEMKILFVSTAGEEELTHFGRPPAHSAFLQKPFSLAALLDKARSVLEENDQSEN